MFLLIVIIIPAQATVSIPQGWPPYKREIKKHIQLFLLTCTPHNREWLHYIQMYKMGLLFDILPARPNFTPPLAEQEAMYPPSKARVSIPKCNLIGTAN